MKFMVAKNNKSILPKKSLGFEADQNVYKILNAISIDAGISKAELIRQMVYHCLIEMGKLE